MALKSALLGTLLALTLAPAAEARTVSYFLANPAEREQTLRFCRNDEAEARKPDCANAQAAADRAAWRGRQRPVTPTPQRMLSSPAYYAQNALVRAITIDQCNRGKAPPADCDAARAAGR